MEGPVSAHSVNIILLSATNMLLLVLVAVLMLRGYNAVLSLTARVLKKVQHEKLKVEHFRVKS
jgi:hypothetical protein